MLGIPELTFKRRRTCTLSATFYCSFRGQSEGGGGEGVRRRTSAAKPFFQIIQLHECLGRGMGGRGGGPPPAFRIQIVSPANTSRKNKLEFSDLKKVMF